MTLPDEIRYIGQTTDGLRVYHISYLGYWTAPAHLKIQHSSNGTHFHYSYGKEIICRYFDGTQKSSFIVTLKAMLLLIKGVHGLFKRKLDSRWFFGQSGAPKRGYKQSLYFHLHYPPSLRQVYPDLPKSVSAPFRAKDRDSMFHAKTTIIQLRQETRARFINDYTYSVRDSMIFSESDDHITYME